MKFIIISESNPPFVEILSEGDDFTLTGEELTLRNNWCHNTFYQILINSNEDTRYTWIAKEELYE